MAANKLPKPNKHEPVSMEVEAEKLDTNASQQKRDPQPTPPSVPTKGQSWRSIPEQGVWVFVAILLVSLLIHIGSGYELNRLSGIPRPFLQSEKKPTVKVRIVKTKKKQQKKIPDEETVTPEKILEAKQEKTEKPKEASHLGHTDHATEKETRVDNNTRREKAADAGIKGNPKAQKTPPRLPQIKRQKPQEKVAQPKPKTRKQRTADRGGKLSFDTLKPNQPRNRYEAMLPSQIHDIPGQLNAGFQDYIDEEVEIGDRIDINTTEYRYIGYFTNMRKAIELVWTYPNEAARKGMQGIVGLEFAIAKDGTTSRVKVLRTSGYEILDRAIVEAIKLASPFSPLPDGFGKERLVVTGSFRYVLGGFGGH